MDSTLCDSSVNTVGQTSANIIPDILVEYKINDKVTELQIGTYPKVIITTQMTPDRPYYFIESKESDDDWIHKINLYSIGKKIPVSDIIKLVKKFAIESLRETTDVSKTDGIDKAVRTVKTNVNEFLISDYINSILILDKDKITITLENGEIDKWNVTLKNFSNIHMNKVDVKMKILFDQEKYPMHPPCILEITPIFANSLNSKIINLQILMKENWKSAYSMRVILTKIYCIIDTYGKIGENNIVDVISDTLISNLASTIGITDEFVDSCEYSTNICKKDGKPEEKKIVGKHGVGYDDIGTTNWKVGDYVQKRKERDAIISCIMLDISTRLKNQSEIANKCMANPMLARCIMTILREMTAIDLIENQIMYNTVYTVLGAFQIEYLKKIINITHDSMTIVKCIENNIELVTKMNETTSDAIKKILDMKKIIDECKTPIMCTECVKQETVDVDKYVSEMTKYRFMESDIVRTTYYYSQNIANKPTIFSKKGISRICAEYASLSVDLPINHDASIFVKVDPSNMSVMRAMIIGPKDTPYENGCFIFDIYIPGTYPSTHPEIQFMNHCGVRFNPNLYASGKVCLSLIGTWGDRVNGNSENWNSETSTLFQLLLSVQSQILVEDPWFNEPGRDGHRNNPRYRDTVEEYNNEIQLYTIQHAIIGLADTTIYGDFTEIIKNHLKLKRDEIHKRYSTSKSPPVVKFYESHKHILDKL